MAFLWRARWRPWHLCCAFFENVTPEVFVLVPTNSSSVALLQLMILPSTRHCVAQRGKGAVHVGAPLQMEDCPRMLPLAITILPPKLTSPSHSFLCQARAVY